MARIPIAPPDMKDQRPRYTLGWRVGNTIYVAGQLPYDKNGTLIGVGDASTLVQIGNLAIPDALIEIEAIAVLDS